MASLIVGWAAVVDAQEATIGQPAPDFALTDTMGQAHTLSGLKGKYVVLEWTNYDCPFVKKHYRTGNMQKLQKKYVEKGVVWLSINSSAPGKQGHYPPEQWNESIKEHSSASTAVLLDPDGKVGKLYGAKTTPHMFVINPEGVLVYKGAIDDKPSFDAETVKTATNYVELALDAAMAGKPVATPETQAYGCSVKY
ncbi:MAG: alkyl hydroperoxide reductase [Lentisphaerae bacterium GWF2_57_35]|nr:MAG: alkyl hydroperoxide reductase [Lentisphaerae bacterium GWF2_57_35]